MNWLVWSSADEKGLRGHWLPMSAPNGGYWIMPTILGKDRDVLTELDFVAAFDTLDPRAYLLLASWWL